MDCKHEGIYYTLVWFWGPWGVLTTLLGQNVLRTPVVARLQKCLENPEKDRSATYE